MEIYEIKQTEKQLLKLNVVQWNIKKVLTAVIKLSIILRNLKLTSIIVQIKHTMKYVLYLFEEVEYK